MTNQPLPVRLWKLDCTRLLQQQYPDFLRPLQPAAGSRVSRERCQSLRMVFDSVLDN